MQETYLVGGAVRDRLLGLPVTDRDWVVVGATPQELLDAGYLPVGRDFPVFLHPQTREEVALARTERKTAPGYHGFAFHAAPQVTLEQDLSRRDLTINAMAEDAAGRLIDPFGGARDLREKRLRHVSPAFAEDPVRILRLARFAARFPDFEIAPETLALARQMVENGDADALVAERVWQELARGLMESRPSRMLEVLRGCGALDRLLPELHAGAELMRVVDFAAASDAPLAVRFACLAHGLAPVALAALAQRLRVPVDCRARAEVVARERGAIERSAGLDAAALVALLERCDALRKPARFGDILLACECIAGAGDGPVEAPLSPRERLLAAQAAALAVPTAEVAEVAAARGLAGPQIGAAVRDARIAAVAAALAVRP